MWEGLLVSSVSREQAVREGEDAQDGKLTGAMTKIVCFCPFYVVMLFDYWGGGERQRERSRNIYAYCPRCVLRYCNILPLIAGY